MQQTTKDLADQAEGLQNTLNERVIPGLQAAIVAIQGVSVSADIVQGVAQLRAVVQQLEGCTQALTMNADAIEALHKDSNTLAVLSNLRQLSGVVNGIVQSIGALQRHGPKLNAAIHAAVTAEADNEVALDAETGNLVPKAMPAQEPQS